MGKIGTPSVYIAWDDVVAAQPEVLVLMPCGFGIARGEQEIELLTRRPGWSELPAVRHGRVHLTDGSSYYNRSGPRLIDGLEILAELIHPELVRGMIPAGAVKTLAVTAAP